MIIDELKKQCGKCRVIGGKDGCGFRKRKDSKDGFRNYCKFCCSETESKCYYKKHEEYKKARIEYYRNNTDEITLRIRRDRKRNLNKYRKKDREKYHKNPKKYIARVKIFYEKNKETILLNLKKDRINNPLKYKEIYKKNFQRRKKNPKALIGDRMRNLVYQSLRGNKNGKSWKILVGYNLETLEKHLKKTIPHGYDWQDFLDGKLHIDHIIPIAVFNFTKPEHIDFKRCWALKNLQLLTAKENFIKNCKIEKHFQPSLLI